MTYGFVAIELLDFSKIQIFIFIAQERSWYLGFKIYTPYVKSIDCFDFCVNKNVSKKIFLYKSLNKNDSRKQKTTCTFLYMEKSKNKCETFIYMCKKPDTLQKARQYALHFYSQKSRHFTLRNFSLKLRSWHLYIFKKHDTLRYVTFLNTKPRHFEKSRKFSLRFFIYIKPDTLCYSIFHGIFETGGGEGAFL